MEVKFNEEGRPIRRPSGNYYQWFITWVISELERGVAQCDLISQYGLKKPTIRDWVNDYASAAYKSRRKMPTAEFRHTVVRAIAQGRMTEQEACAAGNRANRRTIRKWIKDAQQENLDLAAINQSDLGKKKSLLTIGEGQEQIKLLQQHLADEKLRVAALNTLIDVAEQQLKINMR